MEKEQTPENPGFSVVWQGLTSPFATDMDILGKWLERWYLGVQENEQQGVLGEILRNNQGVYEKL